MTLHLNHLLPTHVLAVGELGLDLFSYYYHHILILNVT